MSSTFKETLKDLRQKRSMSQDDLAVKLGVSRVSVSNYESGRATPDYDALLKLSEIFNVTTDHLLGRPGAEKHAFSTELTSDEQRMMDQFLKDSEALIRSKGNVSEAQLRKILKFMAVEFEEDIIDERNKNK